MTPHIYLRIKVETTEVGKDKITCGQSIEYKGSFCLITAVCEWLGYKDKGIHKDNQSVHFEILWIILAVSLQGNIQYLLSKQPVQLSVKIYQINLLKYTLRKKICFTSLVIVIVFFFSVVMKVSFLNVYLMKCRM